VSSVDWNMHGSAKFTKTARDKNCMEVWTCLKTHSFASHGKTKQLGANYDEI
jgi:hypothetical protein